MLILTRRVGETLHRVVVGSEQGGHLLLELAQVILEHAQFFQREREHATVDGMQRRRTVRERPHRFHRRRALAACGER